MFKTSQTSLKISSAQIELEAGSKDQTSKCFDLIGIGFGPSNLSLSVRIAEENLSQAHDRIVDSKSGDSDEVDKNLVSDRSLKTCFIESNECFRWHPGMMIDGSRMQISFLKDLVTLRNPCSPFSFLNYLHCHQRLTSFINSATFNPTRLEFADYLAWVARRVLSCSTPATPISSHVHNSIGLSYGQRVISVKALQGASGDVDLLLVSSSNVSNNAIQHHLCRNLIISAGGTPRIPRCFEPLLSQSLRKSCHVIHTSTYLGQIDHILSKIVPLTADPVKEEQPKRSIFSSTSNRSNSSISVVSSGSSDGPSPPCVPTDLVSDSPGWAENPTKLRIAVIGGGQSAAEALLETYNRLKSPYSHLGGIQNRAEIDLIIKHGHLKPSDDSPFVNQVFDPLSTDFFYELSSKELPTRLKNSAKSHHQSKVKDFLLKESASTNYAVISPDTLVTLYEVIYAQKVRQDMQMDQRSDSYQHQSPTINIINYSEIISAEPNSSQDGSVDVILEHVLTGNQTRSRYHAVILGTGYLRQSWKHILFGKSTECPSSGIHLADLWPNLSVESQARRESLVDHMNEDSPTNSIYSSRSSDEQDLHSCRLSETSQKTLNDLKVARNYRLLLPTTFVELNPSGSPLDRNIKKFRPTIWLQGCNELSHGISDSLLSVLSVRSGEIFDGIREEGWFGQPSEEDKD